MPGAFDEGLGALFGSSEKAYEEGRALGAKTEEALANARRRVMENDALARGRQTLVAAGVPEADADAAYTALQGGGKLDDPIQLMLKNQEFGFRKTAGDPNTSPGDANAALRGVSSGPNEPLYKIGGGYASKFGDTDTVTPLPAGAAGGEGGGKSSAMQYLAAAGALDPNGNVRPGWEKFAWRVQNPTQKTVMVGGVPTLVTDNPWEDPAAAPPPGSAPPGIAPAGAAPPRPTVRATPLATTEQVAANEGAVKSATEQGAAIGRNAAGLESTNATIDKFTTDIDAFLNQPGFDSLYGNLQGTEIGKMAGGLVSQDISNARAAVDSLGGEAFLASIQKMRGFGQLSNQEGVKVQTALTRALDTRIGSPEARAAWQEVKKHMAELKRVAAIEAGQGGAQQAPTAPAAAAPIVKMIGGKKYVQQNGQWFEDDGT